ncbi:MAG TPA: hypothetical protein VGB98_20990 [Pyrinomonadaceae bacterium]
MREPQSQQTLRTEEEATLVVSGEEATLVAPRFDDEETLVAQPVVPLDAEEAEAAQALTPATYAATPLPAYTRRRSFAPRRSWVLAIALVSVLVGGVLGGAGLYIYQRQSQDDRAVSTPQAETPTETQPQPQEQPAPETTLEASNAPQPEAPAAVAEPPGTLDAEPAADAEAAVAPPTARAPAPEPAAERRDAAQPVGNTGTRKRGKKGEPDAEPVRARPVAQAPAPPEARRVDTIFYRERRAMRRERARARRDGGGVDRLRRIFEGAPE